MEVEGLGEGEELWKKYCSFFDKPFSEQVEYNELKLKEYFKRWKQTKMAKQLCPKGVKKFDDVPLTNYENYPILHEFGKKVEHLEKTVPRRKGELWWEYYDRIGRKVIPMIDGWMVDEYGFCSKTAGTIGESKWLVYGKSFSKNLDSLISHCIMACSDRWGDTTLRKGDTFLNITAPPPYISGFYIRHLQQVLKPVPPPNVVDEITNMRKKMWMVIKIIEKGQKIDVGGAIASVFYMFSKYFTKPDEFFKEYYQSMNFGIIKFLLFLKYLHCKVAGKKYKKARDVMPVKGIGVGGYDTRQYFNYIRNEFGVTPTSGYGSTEFGMIMHGHTDRKMDYLPDLRDGYFEFLTEKGKIKKIDELKKGQVYDLVGTPFGSILIRYEIGDQLRVIDFRDDGLPIFDVEGRKKQVIDIYGYYRLTQAMAVKVLYEAGLKETDKWCVVKRIDPKEHICVLMEREWKHPEREAAKLVFEAMKKVNPGFRNYVTDFRIKDPSEVIKVEYLRKGAFMRYTMNRVKEGAALGNVKPPKIITVDRSEVADLLRSV
jgi:hypothetical protein